MTVQLVTFVVLLALLAPVTIAIRGSIDVALLLLYSNEIGADGINAKSDRLYEVVRRLKARGVPIDGVSFQAHFNRDGVPASA